MSFHRILSATLLCCLLVLLFSSPVQAAQIKTYTINSQSAFNYTTTGATALNGGLTSTWYHEDWQYRQKISISNAFVAEDLTNFPLLVRLDTIPLEGASDDLHDVLFTANDGVTRLSHAIEDRNNVWVKIPTLSRLENTVIYLYYGNPESADMQRSSDVWSADYRAMWYMNTDPASDNSDLVEGRTATARGGMNATDSLVEGQIGKATVFDGSNDYYQITDTSEAEDKVATLSSWIKLNSLGSGYILSETSTTDADPVVGMAVANGGARTFIRGDNPAQGVSFSAGPRIEGAWHYVVLTMDGEQAVMYVDGEERDSRDISGIGSLTLKATTIGALRRTTVANYLNAVVDTVSLASAVRTPSWIRAEYTNQCNCEDFLSISDTVESSPTATLGTEQATIQLKADRPLSFASLSAFTSNASSSVTYQLSNDAGKTWHFYGSSTSPQATAGWKSANPANPDHRSSANDINGHLTTFPTGDGKLLWRAYLPAGTSLDSIQIGYIPGTSSSLNTATASAVPATSLQDFRVQSLNTLFRSAFNRTPTPGEWTHWVTRMLSEGKALDGWLGAMEYSALFGQ